MPVTTLSVTSSGGDLTKAKFAAVALVDGQYKT
jgi:hypothetical protein